jgi:hypothetical protein
MRWLLHIFSRGRVACVAGAIASVGEADSFPYSQAVTQLPRLVHLLGQNQLDSHRPGSSQ